MICGIEGMFHQVAVNPENRNVLRFLCGDNGNFDSHPTEYRMTVHLFGATSSPGFTNFALKKTASDYQVQCGSEKNFYVDDSLKSVSMLQVKFDLRSFLI